MRNPTWRVLIVLAAATVWTGCDKKKTPEAPPAAESADVAQGPILHETLTSEQLARIDKINDVFADVDGKTHDKLIDGFKREVDVDHELGIWEDMAKSYRRYLDAHADLVPDARKDAFKILLMRSITPEDEVLERLKLKVLSREDAVEVMRKD